MLILLDLGWDGVLVGPGNCHCPKYELFTVQVARKFFPCELNTNLSSFDILRDS
jgi:hypothetical protein